MCGDPCRHGAYSPTRPHPFVSAPPVAAYLWAWLFPGMILIVFVSSVKVEVLFQDDNDWARIGAWWGQGGGLQRENL